MPPYPRRGRSAGKGKPMRLPHRITLLATTAVLFSCWAYAQETSKEKTGIVSATASATNNPPQTATVRVQAPFANQVITGAPYCAEVTTDRIQTLADGTHITQKTQSTKMCRDSQGRTRRETSPGGAQVVEIYDSASGFRYLLDPQNRVAHRFAPPAEKTDGVVSYTQTARADSPVSNATPARSATPAQAQANRPEHVTESLGTQVIEGVLVEGTKMTTTFPVGAMGNDRPIVRVTESWHSPDLKITVLSKNSDPRMGEFTMRLQNIDRTEPDPALFRVPTDYQIVEENGDQVEIKVTRP